MLQNTLNVTIASLFAIFQPTISSTLGIIDIFASNRKKDSTYFMLSQRFEKRIIQKENRDDGG